MDTIKNAVIKFLKTNDMYYEDIPFIESREDFISEMEKGLTYDEGTLKMIPTYLTIDGSIPENKPVIVMDAGGTNFRVAVVIFDDKKRSQISDFSVYPMPGSDREISKEEFYNKVVDYVEPVLNKSDRIGFCFSYPTEVLPNKDGIVLQMSKQVKIDGIIGDIVGENILKRIKERGYGDKKIVILNDTVATLLGGKAFCPEKSFESYIGFILGTGTNTCYIEDCRNIKKIANADESSNMIINMESGGYGKIKRGAVDREFDMEMIDTNEYLFEKMVSGRYLGPLIFKTIKKAAESNLFTGKFSSNINKLESLNLKDVSEFLNFPYSDNVLSKCCFNEDDRLTLFYIIDFMIERAAKIIAISLAGTIKKIGKGKNPLKPVCITADGSTFYKLKGFREKLDYYVRKNINDEMECFVEFVKIDNAPVIGAAIAGLIN
ncbi:MAG: hypothetical protein N2448_09535 [Caloramator sp.]|nr:hypothetical protein [Caloramator sp.]